MTDRLINNIKIVAIVLTSLNLVGFSCSLYLESFNNSSLLLTITLQMLVIITYLIVIIYSKWVSEHFSSLNANQTQFAEELDHLNKALNEEFQLIKSHITTQANNFKINSEEAFGKINEENERLSKEFSLLIEKVENNRDGFDKKQKEIIDKIDVGHSNAVLRNKTTIESISQLRLLLNGVVEEIQNILAKYKAENTSSQTEIDQNVRLLSSQLDLFKVDLLERSNSILTGINSFKEEIKASSNELKATLSDQHKKIADSLTDINSSKDLFEVKVVEELQTLIQNYSDVIDIINKGNNQLSVSILQTDKNVNEGLKINQDELSLLKANFIDAQKSELQLILDQQKELDALASIEKTKREIELKREFEQLLKHQQKLEIDLSALIHNADKKETEVIREILENQLLQFNNLQNVSSENLNDKLEKLHHKVEKHNISFNSFIKHNQIQDMNVLTERLKELPLISKELRQFPSSLESSIQKQKNEINKSILINSTINYERIDALLSIHKFIDLKAPLPIMHDWRVSSDYALATFSHILEKGKGSVIDIGSGISTLLFAYAVEKNGRGKVISLEHSKEYYDQTNKLLLAHGLESFCELYYCPLKEYELDGEKWLWYDLKNVKIKDTITLISVDGPPGSTQHMARFPAVPILKKFIDEQTVVFLDDGYREEESLIASKWSKIYNLKSELIKSHKGYFTLRLV
jgi:hypothetical protein